MSLDLKERMQRAVLAFRGYNVANLGRTAELLAHPAYGSIVRTHLREAGGICSEVMGRKVDLVRRIRRQQETTLKTYGDATALIMAVEVAQLDLLEQFFGIDYHHASLMFGYSLGEISALVAGGVFDIEDALRIPLHMASDGAELAANVTLAVLFSRGPVLPLDQVHRQCLRINSEGRGVISPSAYLSPNSLLLIGQGDTIDRFKSNLRDVLPDRVYLRKNKNRWPPLHTPIVWERNISNRSEVMLHTIRGGFCKPFPDVFSLVTGKASYNDYNAREIIGRWIDQPQRLWDAIYETLQRGIETVIHVGPAPNIIPATFQRLSVDVDGLTRGSIGMRALSGIVRRPWLSALLPSRTALLRAPLIRHISLEDWLLEQKVS